MKILEVRVIDIFAVGNKAVFTGKVENGTLSLGQKVSLRLPDNSIETRVNGIEIDRTLVSKAVAGQEVGIVFNEFKMEELNEVVKCLEESKTNGESGLKVLASESAWWRFW